MPEITTRVRNQKLIRENRRKLINAVTKLFGEKGYDRTSMREISKKSGMTTGNIYNYIGKKEDLLFMVHDDMMKGVYGFDNNHTEWRNLDELRHYLKGAFLHTLEYKKEILLMYRQSWLLGEEALESLLASEKVHILKMKGFLDEANKKGIVRIQDAELTASIIVYMMSLLVLRGWSLRDYKKRQAKLIDSLVNIIIKILT